jgi:hypothetical protein
MRRAVHSDTADALAAAPSCTVKHCRLVCLMLQADQGRLSARRSQRLVASTLRAVVRFARPEEAHRAQREKQGGYILNAPVMMRVLQ